MSNFKWTNQMGSLKKEFEEKCGITEIKSTFIIDELQKMGNLIDEDMDGVVADLIVRIDEGVTLETALEELGLALN